MALSADPVCVDDMVASPFNQMAHGFSGPFIKPGSKHRYISRKLMVANPLKDYDWNPRLGKLFYIFCRKTCRTDNDSIVLKKDTVKTLIVGKELKALAYMAMLLIYSILFKRSFLISTILLGVATLAMTGTKKKLYYVIVIAMVVVLYLLFAKVLHIQLP